ncbi:ROK family protein [Streptomyces sp. CB02261]|uniref:ROK family protein n=1 Tax=Streptomyces sp. CB02261 TaxID=1703940 RepID=UPI00093C02EC|nr:ROK family protein [Streptomyces sp. CB02261]OKJ61646.1 ROK family transcriptional regulator [Streptomyces sp. CB02261]
MDSGPALAGSTPPPAHAPGCVVGLDVGGTGMKGALLDHAMRSLETVRRPTPRADGPLAVVDAITDTLLTLTALAAERDLPVHHAGVVVPGIVDEGLQRAVWSANIGWRDLPLAALLTERTGLRVTLGHDVRAGGLAERAFGAARGARNVLFVAIGTGIAAALVCDGEPVSSGGYAGELGHVVVEPGGRPCACGGTGCLETVASATAVAAAYAERAGRPVAGAADVAALAADDDPLARAVWQRAADGLADALATATSMLAPESIVLGGGLAEAGDLLLDPVRAGLERRLTFQRPPALVRAELGDWAGCLGAGLAGWRATGHAPANRRTGVPAP